jgi:K+-transporting ATPase KdpF subunit
VGHHESVRSRLTGDWRLQMFDYILSGIVSILLLIYLSWAMFQPEKF